MTTTDFTRLFVGSCAAEERSSRLRLLFVRTVARFEPARRAVASELRKQISRCDRLPPESGDDVPIVEGVLELGTVDLSQTSSTVTIDNGKGESK